MTALIVGLLVGALVRDLLAELQQATDGQERLTLLMRIADKDREIEAQRETIIAHQEDYLNLIGYNWNIGRQLSELGKEMAALKRENERLSKSESAADRQSWNVLKQHQPSPN